MGRLGTLMGEHYICYLYTHIRWLFSSSFVEIKQGPVFIILGTNNQHTLESGLLTNSLLLI